MGEHIVLTKRQFQITLGFWVAFMALQGLIAGLALGYLLWGLP